MRLLAVISSACLGNFLISHSNTFNGSAPVALRICINSFSCDGLSSVRFAAPSACILRPSARLPETNPVHLRDPIVCRQPKTAGKEPLRPIGQFRNIYMRKSLLHRPRSHATKGDYDAMPRRHFHLSQQAQHVQTQLVPALSPARRHRRIFRLNAYAPPVRIMIAAAKIKRIKPLCCNGLSPVFYSHSIVAGGLLVISYTIRLMCGTSPTMRPLARASTS